MSFRRIGLLPILLVALASLALYRHSDWLFRLVLLGPATSGAATLGLPDPALTPGATNPDVTQGNIDQTICVRGWTRTVRPPEEYTERLKREQISAYGYANRRLREYEEDHLIPLELGGAQTDPRNLWPEPHIVPGGWGSFVKDRLENALNIMVCERRITLAAARQAIARNWITAYRQVFARNVSQ
jgi:hypothetical protein